MMRYGIKQTKFVYIFILTIILVMLWLLSHTPAVNTVRPTTQHRHDLLGTIITISIFEKTDASVFDEVFGAIEDVDAKMSATNPSSQVSMINAMAGIESVRVSDDVFHVITLAMQISRNSKGAFDLSVGPLVSLWNIGSLNAGIPAGAEILKAKGLVGYNNVLLDPGEKSVHLKKKGMRIDLGGIAKGYAGDVATEILKRRGIKNAIIDLGGDIIALGSRPNGDYWRIGIKTPIRGDGSNVGVLRVRDKAVATAGGYERYYEKDGVFHHHILDPYTGYPADAGLLSVTVVSYSSVVADKLSTAAFVLGYERGRALVESYGADAIFITDDKTIYITNGIIDSFTLTNNDFSRGLR